MFFSDKHANDVLNRSKKIVDHINKNKKVEYSTEFKNMQYLIFAGMYRFYGSEHLDKIVRAFSELEFYHCTESMEEALFKYSDYPYSLLMENFKIEPEAFVLTEYDYFTRTVENRKLFTFAKKGLSPEKLLDCTMHEINHIVNAVEKSILSAKDSSFLDIPFISRVGVHCVYSYLDGTKKETGKFFEEAFNTLQTGEAMDNIFDLKNFNVADSELRKMLDSFESIPDGKYQCRGYGNLVPIMRPLYDNSIFNSYVTDKRLSGDIDDVQTHFDGVVGEGSYSELLSCFDTVFTTDDNFERFMKKDDAKILINRYNRKTM